MNERLGPATPKASSPEAEAECSLCRRETVVREKNKRERLYSFNKHTGILLHDFDKFWGLKEEKRSAMNVDFAKEVNRAWTLSLNKRRLPLITEGEEEN